MTAFLHFRTAQMDGRPEADPFGFISSNCDRRALKLEGSAVPRPDTKTFNGVERGKGAALR
jgi:hypothetical protein